MTDDPRFTVEPPPNTCPECGTQLPDAAELERHLERHTGAARDSDNAGGTLPDEQHTQGGYGRVQTE